MGFAAGWGVFATQPIPKNTRIVDYAGVSFTQLWTLMRWTWL